MSVDGWNTVLVLGGIRSGKSEFAESLVADAANVRYVATATGGDPDDAEWAARLAAHRSRRPESWTTEETGDDPRRLADVLASAQPHETLLVDDLGGWVTVLLDPVHQPADDTVTIAELADAVRSCPARLVLVSPEVGLSLVPTTPLGRAFADALGTANRAVADACDAVALVVAGQPCWLKPGTPLPDTALPAAAPDGPTATATAQVPAGGGSRGPLLPLFDEQGTPATTPAPAATSPDASRVAVPAQAGPAGPDVLVTASTDANTGPAAEPPLPEVLTPVVAPSPDPAVGTSWAAPTMALPMVATGLVIQGGMELPLPDEHAGPQALEHLATRDVPGTGLGVLERVVGFAAATQGTPTPKAWGSVRVLLLHGDHEGGVAAGSVAGESARRAAQARAGVGVLARLAAESEATIQVVDAPTAAPIEDGPALTGDAVESALRHGWRLAEEAAEAGVHLLVLAACGAGTDAAAAAVLAATAGAEPPAVLGRVVRDGRVDDAAWMTRCATVRDALHRTRGSAREPKAVLADLGGGDIAVATGILLGAAARRLPVLLDGPVGVAAGMVGRDLAGQTRHWCLLPDHGGHPAVRLAADVLGLTPLLDLRLDLGEGANALAALPLLRSVLALAAALPARDDDADTPEPADDEEAPEFAEPEPSGPGPATTGSDDEERADTPGQHAG
ncbi:nicotinate-nucleotide--dimethylbenzimidazole phosphoribosyltransferase [Micromonospora pallida]|uniref:Adenosylcobinamide kinase n=1 Tax=Micromonospora pallida TaxID=145854 RepID=A0A1C6RLG9_9ACTN|nr:bifunctional adenosylcobinamide kinase/adenosylcobinamide-phosphate guanylyltransferase [Micromonospora pallida]SCL17874.1 nicotinate-nucleotide--dimethylbenzimidazole phosphoribosyltransferase [Micromonospora pallida]